MKRIRLPLIVVLFMLLLSWGGAYSGSVNADLLPGGEPSHRPADSPPWLSPGETGEWILLLDGPSLLQSRQRLRDGGGSSGEEALQLRLRQRQLAQQRGRLHQAARDAGIPIIIQRSYSFVLNGLLVDAGSAGPARLAQLPGVAAVYPDQLVQLDLIESVPLVGAPAVWEEQDAGGSPILGSGVEVAVIDTGIDYTHPDLGGCFGAGCKVAGGYDLYNNDSDPWDDNGHGTHCAGVIAADGALTGIAPGATLYAYKVVGAGGGGAISTIISGIEMAVDRDGDPGTADAVDIISMSMGYLGTPDDPWSTAVNAAADAGVLVVTSAGNNGPAYSSMGSPGMSRGAFAVGAADKSDVIADFSSRGPVPGQYQLVKPDIIAPGVDIVSTYPGALYAPMNGTSMAAPHVAGAAALLMQAHPEWPSGWVRANLMNRAADIGYDPYQQGAGRLQVDDALSAPALLLPPSAGLGEVDNSVPIWQPAQPFQLINLSGATLPVSAAIQADLPAGAAAAVSLSTTLLAPGESAAITLTLSIDTHLAPPDIARSGGRLLISAGSATLSAPFAYYQSGVLGGGLELAAGFQSVYDIALGDLDGDGDLDAFSGAIDEYESADNRVWLNSGEGLFRDSMQRLGSSSTWGVSLADLDGDGDLDAFAANGLAGDGEPDQVWFNDGSGGFSDSGQSLGDTASRAAALGDLDGDGDTDAFVANGGSFSRRGEPNRVWFNNGAGLFTDSGQSLSNNHSQGAALGDLDGDGDLDAFVSNGDPVLGKGEGNRVWLNNGSGVFSDSGQELGNSISQAAALADVDGDGDLDALVANGSESVGQPDRLWLNNGSGLFTDSGQEFPPSRSFAVLLADFHGDGAPDAVISDIGGGSQMWLNDGLGHLAISGPAVGQSRGHGAAAGDVDGDGDVDLLIGSDSVWSSEVWFNRGSGRPTSSRLTVRSSRGDGGWRLSGPQITAGRGSRVVQGLAEGVYQLSWKAVPGCGTPPAQSVTVAGGTPLTVDGAYSGCPPTAPGILSPPAGAVTDRTPTFGWLAMPAGSSYQIQIDDSASFNSPWVDAAISSAGYQSTISLPAGQAYWRLRAAGGPWTAASPFTVMSSQSLPFYEGFEDGAMAPFWQTAVTNEGYVNVSPDNPYAGDYNLLLADSASNDTFSAASAAVMLDMSGQEQAALSYRWANWLTPVAHGQSGVYISGDYGASWHQVSRLDRLSGGYQLAAALLTPAAAAHGLPLSDHLLIRLQFYGRYSVLARDGLAFDEVRVYDGLAAPSGLTAAASGAADILLSWQDNELTASGYSVERSLDGVSGWQVIGETAGESVFLDQGIACGQRRYYRVQAFRDGDQQVSPFSNVAAGESAACPPLAPSELSAAALSHSEISLSWTDNAAAESAYLVERSADGVSGWSQIGSSAADAESYVDGGLSCGQSWFYRVRAYRQSDGQYSSYSGSALGSTFACPPAAPSGLIAQPASLTAVDLSWQDNAGSESAYLVERSADGGAAWAQIGSAAADSESYHDGGVSCGTSWIYRVRAFRESDGQYSAYSGAAAASTGACLVTAPSGLTADPIAGDGVLLSWQDNSGDESGFAVERSTDINSGWTEAARVAAGVTSYSDDGLACGQTYQYRVRAFRESDGAYSGYSNLASAASAPCPLEAPSQLTATVVSASRIDLSWQDNSSGENGFAIERVWSQGSEWLTLVNVPGDSSSYSDLTVSCGQGYRYRVRAFNSVNGYVSAYTEPVNAVSLPCLPVIPLGLTAEVVSKTEVLLSWQQLEITGLVVHVERKASDDQWSEIGAAGAGQLTYVDSGLSCGLQLQYRVHAYRLSDGLESQPSVTIQVALEPCGSTGYTLYLPVTAVSESSPPEAAARIHPRR